MTAPTPAQGQKIETLEQLSEWLLSTRPRAVCVIAQGKKATEVSCILVDADKKFAQALMVASEFIIQTVEHLDPSVRDSPAPLPRAERRRLERRR